MEEIKDLVAQALEKKRVLSKLKAELRAEVFLAIDEEEKNNGQPGLAAKTENARRASLQSSTTGPLAVGLVREFLSWAGMEFTLKVFDPEMASQAAALSRTELAGQLGLSTPAADKPLLMALMESGGLSAGTTTAASRPSSVPPPSTPASRLAPLQPATDPAATQPQPALPAKPVPAPTAPSQSQPPLVSAASKQSADVSYADDIEMEIDDSLEGAEIMDDDEDYEGYVAGSQATRAVPSRSADIMSGDRSFDPSHELAGLAPPSAPGQRSDTGRMSGSGELTHADNPVSASLSGDLSKPAKLDSLPAALSKPAPAKLGGLAPLGKPPGALAPLAPAAGLAPLNAPAAMARPAPLGNRRDPNDIKAELRRAGLLNSDSYSMDADPDLHEPSTTATSKAQPTASAGAIRPVHGGVYDAEVSVMTSADQSTELPADTVEAAVRSSDESDGQGLSRSGLVASMYHPSKGLSMEMRDTGLSASDRSGELESGMHADFAETAEWT